MKTKIVRPFKRYALVAIVKEIADTNTHSEIGGNTLLGGHPQVDWIKAHWKTVSLGKILFIVWLGDCIW